MFVYISGRIVIAVEYGSQSMVFSGFKSQVEFWHTFRLTSLVVTHGPELSIGIYIRRRSVFRLWQLPTYPFELESSPGSSTFFLLRSHGTRVRFEPRRFPRWTFLFRLGMLLFP